MRLYRLIYKSETADYLDWADLKDILLKSQENNAELEVTGLLILAGREFLQVLEGPAEGVNALYAKILQDARHKNSRILSYGEIAERRFSDWAMRGINIALMDPDVKTPLLKKYGAAGDSLAIPDDPFLAFSLLYDIYWGAQ